MSNNYVWEQVQEVIMTNRKCCKPFMARLVEVGCVSDNPCWQATRLWAHTHTHHTLIFTGIDIGIT